MCACVFVCVWENNVSNILLLIGLRSYQDKKADVILKYSSDEGRKLEKLGHLKEPCM